MGSIRARSDSGQLFLDFRCRGIRCRELTLLDDTKDNRVRLAKVLARIEREMAEGIFDYRRHFPNSTLAAKFDGKPASSAGVGAAAANGATGGSLQSTDGGPAVTTPPISEFVETWFEDSKVTWRKSYVRTVRDILDRHIISHFGTRPIAAIRRSDILEFRSRLAAKPGHRKGATLSPARVNTVMVILGQIINEAADRFEFNTPYRRIKPLKVPKSDGHPFTMEQVEAILTQVRPDYRDYYCVRFLTGMRTGEIDGLKWKFVDFDRRLILIRETIVVGDEEYTKNDSSQRDIAMSQPVFEALKRQLAATSSRSRFVFCNSEGKPLEHNNVTKRVWYPLLRRLKLEKRRPYQSRHTAATLWLAAGENPEWIARQLGHANTQMLFTVYSRFVPNLTRRDGSAFERMISSTIGAAANLPDAHHAND